MKVQIEYVKVYEWLTQPQPYYYYYYYFNDDIIIY